MLNFYTPKNKYQVTAFSQMALGFQNLRQPLDRTVYVLIRISSVKIDRAQLRGAGGAPPAHERAPTHPPA